MNVISTVITLYSVVRTSKSYVDLSEKLYICIRMK